MRHMYAGSTQFHQERGEVEVWWGVEEYGGYVGVRMWEPDHDDLSDGEAIICMRPSEARRLSLLLANAARDAAPDHNRRD